MELQVFLQFDSPSWWVDDLLRFIMRHDLSHIYDDLYVIIKSRYDDIQVIIKLAFDDIYGIIKT